MVIGINEINKFSKEEQEFIINYGAFHIERYRIKEFEALREYLRYIHNDLYDFIKIIEWLISIKETTFLGYLCRDEVFVCGEDNTPIPPYFLEVV